MSEWIGAWKVQELYREAQEHRIPFAPVRRCEQMYDERATSDRGSSSSPSTSRVSDGCGLPGAPFAVQHDRRGRCADPRRASESTPRKAARELLRARASPSTDSEIGTRPRLPLEGVRVLDFTAGLGGPVLHAEPGPPRRRGHPHRDDGAAAVLDPAASRRSPTTSPDRAGPATSTSTTRGSGASCSTSRKPEAVELGYELVQHCDVVTDNFSAGVMEKLGLRLREAPRDQAGHHPDLHVRLRADRPVPQVPRLRPAGIGSVGTLLAHRLSGRWSRRDRCLVSRSERRG